MRRAAAVVVLTCLSAAAHAQDARVAGFFGPTVTVRQRAQLDFINHHLTDQSAIGALVDATTQALRNAQGNFSPGVYDAISVLARVPPDGVTDPALRARIVQVAQASHGNSADTAARAALIEPRFASAAQPQPPALPPLPSNPAPAPSAPAVQGGSNGYKITVGSMTVVNRVSHGTDTDYVSLVVIGPDGQIGPFNWGPQKLKQDDHPILDLKSDTVRVASNQPAAVRISWTAANQDTGNGVKVALALGNTAADLARGSGNLYGMIGGELAKVGLTFLQSCDVPLFGGAVVLYTDQLLDGKEFDDWQPEGPNHWHRVFDYPNIASPCGTGHYRLEVHVERRSL